MSRFRDCVAWDGVGFVYYDVSVWVSTQQWRCISLEGGDWRVEGGAQVVARGDDAA